MAQFKRPTVKQKKIIGEVRLNPTNWLVKSEIKETLTIVNKQTGTERVIKK
jgi:hypothetical protein